MSDLATRFWTKAQIGAADDCWEWRGHRSAHGYGRINVDGKVRQAHRIAYELAVGALPEGLVLDHLCRNRACVNPAHLEPVTNRENILRGVGASAQHARKTHCPQGHPYDEANTYYVSSGKRECRICRRVTNTACRRRYRERKRSAAA